MSTLSIDCGTSNTVAFMNINGQVQILKDVNGKAFFPSIVQFINQNTIKFGHGISNNYWKLDDIVRCFKRITGLKMISADLNLYQEDCLAEVFSGPDGYPRFKISHFGDEGITPTDVISSIYREIGRKAREKIEQPIEHLIITIPAFFDQDQRLEAEKAAKDAGICDDIHVVTEPVAAAYQYKLDKLPADSVIMVVDIGAGTLDICIMRQENGEQKVVTTGGERKLGGEDITKVISDALEAKFKQIHDRDLICFPPKTTAYRAKKEALKQLSEDAKRELSEHSSAVVTFNANDFIMARKMKIDSDSDSDSDDSDDNDEFIVDITLNEVRRLTESIMDKVEIAIKNTLRNANMRADEISHVILVGGSAHFIPFQETVKRVFPSNKVRMSDNPEEIVARGALRVLNESILTKQNRLVEQLSHSYGTLVSEGTKDVYVPIIPRGTTFPTTRTFSKTFFQVPLKDNTLYPAADIGLYVCDEMNGGNYELYNPFKITNLDTNPSNSVTLTFSIDDNGVIYAEARQKNGNPVVIPKTALEHIIELQEDFGFDIGYSSVCY